MAAFVLTALACNLHGYASRFNSSGVRAQATCRQARRWGLVAHTQPFEALLSISGRTS
jgi:hypothetical protein